MTFSSLHPRPRWRAPLPITPSSTWHSLRLRAGARAARFLAAPAGRLLAAPAGPRAVGILLAALLAASPWTPAASADTGTALVSGSAAGQQLRVIRIAVEKELRKAGWSLQTLGSAENAALAACFSGARPWPCLDTVQAARRLQRVLAIQIEPDPEPGTQPQLRLTGRLTATEGQRLSIDTRYCGPCSDSQLADAASQLARRLLTIAAIRKETTIIEVRTRPPGATILLDGRMVEATDHAIATSPGNHSVHLQLSGYRAELRTVQAQEGKRVLVDVSFRPDARARQSKPTARLEVIDLQPGAGRQSTSPSADATSRGAQRADESSAAASAAANAADETRAARAAAQPDGADGADQPDGADQTRSVTSPLPPVRPRSLEDSFAIPQDEHRAVTAHRAPALSEADLLAAEQHYEDRHRRRRLGWALTVAGGALIATGIVLFALDEDAEPDPTRRHEPLYFDSAPAGVILMALGGVISTTGAIFVRLSPPPPPNAPAASAAHPTGAIIGYVGQF